MDQKIPINEAALRVRRSYNATLRLLHIGSLTGGRNEKGHWYIDESSIDRFLDIEKASLRSVASAPLTAA